MASADSIVRLKLESGEYEAKIKRATQGLLAMESECRKVGGTLAVLDKEQKDYVEALGRMETVSKTAKGRLAELTSAFTNLSSQYKRLTDEEKKGDFGKALQKSLSELKTRIVDAKNELNGIQSELNDNGNVLDQLAGKFGLSTKQLTEFGAALAIGKTALDTMKGAMESNEATHDAYARTVEVCNAVTNQFLLDLANADFSNFISGLQGVIDKAIDAYNALDEFESYAARLNPAQQAQEAKIQTLMQQARAAKAQGDNAKAERLNNEAKDLINKLEQTTREYGKKQTTAGYATIRGKMGEVDITDQQIAWYADPKNWDKAQQKAKEYQRIQAEINRDNATLNTNLGVGKTAEKMYEEASARLKANQQALRNDPSLKRAYTFQNLRDSGEEGAEFRQALGNIYGNTMAESRIESLRARADRMDGVITRGTSPKGSSKTIKSDISGLSDLSGLSVGPTESLKELNAQLSMYKNLMQEAKSIADMMEAQSGIDRVQKEIKAQPIALSLGVSVDEIVPIQEKIDNYFKENPIKILPIEATAGSGAVTTAKNVEKSWAAASRAIGAAGNALQQVEDPGAKIAGIVGQAIANIALGFATASASPATGAAGVFGWIAASAAGLATMLATITSIKNATEYHAEGGFVGMGGLARGTDTIPAMLTPGELVLNAAQQGNIASAMSSQGQQMDIRHSVRAEDIVIAINNYGRRTGRGEILKG